MGNTRS